MPKKEPTIEEKKAEVLMHLRGYKKTDQKHHPEGITTYIAKTKAGDVILYCVPGQGTIGVQYINKLKKVMKDENLERGIIITSGRYTQAAKQASRKRGIELIPRMFPAFNLFEHIMVPKHEIITDEERHAMLQKYKVQPYQLPYIHFSDPAVKAIGAKPGDIVKITRESQTAGKYFAYRYVVEG